MCVVRKEGHAVYVSDKAVSHVSTSCSAEKKSFERNPHFVSLEKKATLCIYICWRFFCLKSRWFVFLVEIISFSVQDQLHLPLQSSVPFSSSLSPVLRRRAGPKTSVLKKKCIANPPPLLPLGRYPQFFSKFQSILPSALIKSLCLRGGPRLRI